jgi:hypothetical protein
MSMWGCKLSGWIGEGICRVGNWGSKLSRRGRIHELAKERSSVGVTCLHSAAFYHYVIPVWWYRRLVNWQYVRNFLGTRTTIWLLNIFKCELELQNKIHFTHLKKKKKHCISIGHLQYKKLSLFFPPAMRHP